MDLLRFYYTQNPTPMEDEDLFDAYLFKDVTKGKLQKEEAAVDSHNRLTVFNYSIFLSNFLQIL